MTTSTGPGPEGPRVLIVEDDPGNALVMQMVLTRLGRMRVDVTEDGDRVLRDVLAGEVDVIVMDVSLASTRVRGESTDGLELTRRVKAAGREAGRIPKVLLATAHAMRGDRERFLLESGADGYIAKPIVDHGTFVAAVAALAGGRA